MTSNGSMCDCHADQSESCCDAPPAPAPAPNPPGLARIRYRIGTFSTFRRAMLDSLARKIQDDPHSPFVDWREGADGDYLMLFIEIWAYIGDVLTFYQERIANEAFLQTATQRDSLMRLARLIDYHPSPGSSASGLLNFTVEKGKTVLIPASFRAGAKPVPGKDPVVFETGSAFTASGDHNAIPVAVTGPTNQFAPLQLYKALAASDLDSQAAETIYSSAEKTYLGSFTALSAAFTQRPDTNDGASPAGSPIVRFENRLLLKEEIRSVVLDGISANLAIGDYVLVVEHEGDDANEKPTLRRIDEVQIDKARNSTTIFWTEENSSVSYDKNASLFALRVTASPFGSGAPAYKALSPTLTKADGAFPHNWDDVNDDMFFVPDIGVLHLDATYAGARDSAGHRSWVVLLPRKDTTQNIFRVTDAQTVAISDFALVAKVTRLSIGTDTIPTKGYPIRTTVILTGAERLTLQNNLPLPEPVAGDTLVLAGRYPLLKQGQTIVVRGNVIDLNTMKVDDAVTAEEAELIKDPHVDDDNPITTITLDNPLSKTYSRATTVVLANVAAATHGETIRNEVLGSSDGSPFQSYELKKKPLTYLPATDPEQVSAVSSTLLVTVNGVKWTETPTLVSSAPDAQEYTVDQDDTGTSSVAFGDGIAGAKPPTGKDNIQARYRRGLGTGGNVAADALSQLLDSIAGVQKVTNPQPSSGGVDADGIDQIRRNASASLRMFGRAVSVQDYSDLALTFPGVAKASAGLILQEADFRTGKLHAIAQPYIRMVVATSNHVPLAQQSSFAASLREYLDRRRDPNMPLRLTDVTTIPIDATVLVDVDDRFPRQHTTDRVAATLSPQVNPDGPPGFFSFERLQFGQSIALSDLYRAIQEVDGVRSTLVTELRLATDPASTVREVIEIRATELASLKNDPTDPSQGILTVTYISGGFPDT